MSTTQHNTYSTTHRDLPERQAPTLRVDQYDHVRLGMQLGNAIWLAVHGSLSVQTRLTNGQKGRQVPNG